LIAGQQAAAGAEAFAALTGGLMGAAAARKLIEAQTMISIGLVTGTAIAGMAHDGIDTIPREGTWLLNTGERVYTNESAQRIDQMYDQMMSGGAGAIGGAVFEQHLHFTGDMNETERHQMITEAARQGYQMVLEDVGSYGQVRKSLGV
jgi:hypothetical protein